MASIPSCPRVRGHPPCSSPSNGASTRRLFQVLVARALHRGVVAAGGGIAESRRNRGGEVGALANFRRKASRRAAPGVAFHLESGTGGEDNSRRGGLAAWPFRVLVGRLRVRACRSRHGCDLRGGDVARDR